ncbi:hypothetical protein CN679_05585 [Bacillus pseudomycoides]|nr:hypothetical protein CN679_05585 [Bacillus pseudomycoides]
MNKGVNDTLLSNFELMSIQTEVLFSHIELPPPTLRLEEGVFSVKMIKITETNKELLQYSFPNLLNQLKWRQPCFVILENEMIASRCCSARSTAIAAEASVETLVSFQRKGYGYNIVAAWATAVQEEGRIPLYSTSWNNFASQAVAKKLNLINYGTDIHFS